MISVAVAVLVALLVVVLVRGGALVVWADVATSPYEAPSTLTPRTRACDLPPPPQAC